MSKYGQNMFYYQENMVFSTLHAPDTAPGAMNTVADTFMGSDGADCVD